MDPVTARGQVTVTLTPELRRLALLHVAETEQGEDAENLTRWFQEQETPDGHVLNSTESAEEAWMIVVITRALLWEHDRCPDCCVHDPVQQGHARGCDYDVADY